MPAPAQIAPGRAARSLLGDPDMPRRSLWPREHGAYFQLVIPLIAALATPLALVTRH
jgi:hypothetical protein